ncbi:DUF6011 domain-containing protein [Sphingobium sp. MK2]|uniref:DUF6011 domain-containing protein n=1 Tax=Sphingobium sp. MK2 TaxID=3116540 RepID=UPI0032E35FB9
MDREKLEPGAPLREIPAAAIEALHYDTCKACNGSKVFRSYTGRVVGSCFKCKGEGKIGYKQSPEKRAAARNAKANKKQVQIEAWKAAHEEEFAWLTAAIARGFQIASNLMIDLSKFGDLTEGKVALIRRFMAEDIARAEAKVKSIETAKVIDLGKIMTAFDNAAANQVKAPMLRLDRYRFAYKPDKGVIYIRLADKEVEAYFGRIEGGKFFKSRECTPEHEEAILTAAADPHAAAIAYGRREGACSVCGRGLTNHASIDDGIGPICAGRMGW